METHTMSEQSFESFRPLLFSIAYRMLGSAMDAEDVVQDAWLRFQGIDQDAVRDPRAYLSTMVTRLAINQLNAARTRREQYLGPWLPEPLLTDDSNNPRTPAQHLGRTDAISMAFLFMLERLSPAERAVFILREVFDYEYGEISRVLDKSETACRKLFSRARRHVDANRPRFPASAEAHERLVDQFLAVVQDGNVGAIADLLAEDVVVWTDGGGKVFALPQPLHGRERTARFLVGAPRLAPGPFTASVESVNGEAAIVLRVEDGTPFLVIGVANDGRQIQALHIIGNPDKLHHL